MAVADRLRVEALCDLFFDAVESAAANEEYIGRGDLEEFLVGVLASPLGRYVDDRSFEDFEQRLLYALARHVARDRRVVAFAGDLVDLVHVDNANLRALNIAIGGIDELEAEVKAPAGTPAPCKVFPYPIAYNLIPQIGGFNDEAYTSEEMKMQNEGRKMLHDDNLLVSCTCVRVPIIRSHSEALTIEFENEISPEEARELLKDAPGVRLWDEPEEKHYPMPLLTSDQDLVYVGRIRRDLSAPKESYNRSLVLFCCADQVRKGAATNAVQIAELVFGLAQSAF